MISICITGGGTAAIGKLLCKGGASSWFKNAYIPYSEDSTDGFLGFKPKKYVSKETALSLAARMWEYNKGVNISSTAQLVSSKGRFYPDGSKRVFCAHLAIQNDNYSGHKYIELTSETREGEEEELADFIVEFTQAKIDCDDGCLDLQLFEPLQSMEPTTIIFPGSFNPVTKNHIEIASLVEKRYGEKPLFEISMINRDKAPIDFITLRDRFKLINDAGFYATFTKQPYFFQKAKLFPNCKFIIGYDTLLRLNRDHSEEELQTKFKESGTKFIVVQREGVDSFVNKIHNLCEVLAEYSDDGWSSTKERELNV